MTIDILCTPRTVLSRLPNSSSGHQTFAFFYRIEPVDRMYEPTKVQPTIFRKSNNVRRKNYLSVNVITLFCVSCDLHTNPDNVRQNFRKTLVIGRPSPRQRTDIHILTHVSTSYHRRGHAIQNISLIHQVSQLPEPLVMNFTTYQFKD